MKRTGLLAWALCAGLAFAGADDARYVYEIRELSATTTDVWSTNMGVVAEAARLFAPVSFTRSGGTVALSLDATMSFSLGRSTDLERSGERVLVRHAVTVQGSTVLPKADKRSRVRFSLAEIVAKGGAYASSPLMYAFRKAIDGSSYKTGRAWIVSADYDGAGRFVVVVGLSKK